MTIEESVDKLAKSNRNLKILFGLSILVFGVIVMALTVGLLWVGYAIQSSNEVISGGQSGKVITATEFRVVDTEGKKRVVVGLFKDAPVIALYDAQENVRGMFDIADDSPGISLADAHGKVRGMFGILSNGSPWITLNNAQGETIWEAP